LIAGVWKVNEIRKLIRNNVLYVSRKRVLYTYYWTGKKLKLKDVIFK